MKEIFLEETKMNANKVLVLESGSSVFVSVLMYVDVCGYMFFVYARRNIENANDKIDVFLHFLSTSTV